VRHILCFGDSNTWGSGSLDAADGIIERYDWLTRWPGILGAKLGTDFRIIEEGMPGRTTVFDDPLRDYRSGKHYLVPCLNSHRPLDLVIIMLGTNDLQGRFAAAPLDIACGLEVLIDITQKSGAGISGASPQVLVLTPPPIGTIFPLEAPAWPDAQKKCMGLPSLYEALAKRYHCYFADSQRILDINDLTSDGFHLAKSGHAKLGTYLGQRLAELFAENP